MTGAQLGAACSQPARGVEHEDLSAPVRVVSPWELADQAADLVELLGTLKGGIDPVCPAALRARSALITAQYLRDALADLADGHARTGVPNGGLRTPHVR